MLKLDNRCSIIGIQPETVVGMMAVSGVLSRYGQVDISEDCVITSCTDGKHSAKSLHYVGYAFDIRTKAFQEGMLQSIISDCRHVLNDQWDVVDEGDHLHFEFQPKVNR